MLLEGWNEALGEALLMLKSSASNAVAAAAVLGRGGMCELMAGALLVPGLCRFGERLTSPSPTARNWPNGVGGTSPRKALRRSEKLLRELKAAPAASPRHPVPPGEAAPRSVPEGHVLVVAEVKEVAPIARSP